MDPIHRWKRGSRKIKKAGLLLIPLIWAIPWIGVSTAASGGSQNPPIRIGATVSGIGKFSEPSQMIRSAYRLWEDEVNRTGGLLGRKVTLLLQDDRGRTDLVKSLYARLIDEERVDLVFSPYSTPLTLAASAVTESRKYTMLACGASGKVIWERNFRYVFGMYALAERYFIGLLDLAARRDLRRLAVIYDETSLFNQDVFAGTMAWAKRFHVTPVYGAGFGKDLNTLFSCLTALRAHKPDILVVSAYPPDCYSTLGWMRRTGYRPPVLGMTIAPVHPDFHKSAGDMADRVFGPSQWEPDERIPYPGTRRFIDAFRRFTGETPSYHAGSAYAACQIYARAVRQAGSLNNDRLRDYIASLDTVTVIGRFKVDAAGRQIGHNPIIIQWQEGKKEIVWPVKMQTGTPRF